MTERFAMTVDEAAKLSGVGRTTMFAELRSGRLHARKIGRRTIITAAELQRWIDALPNSRKHATLDVSKPIAPQKI